MPIGAYLDDENPDTGELINSLQIGLIANIENGSYKMAGLAIDVLVERNGQKVDAMEIRIFSDGSSQKLFQLPYRVDGDEIIFEGYS